MASLKEQYGDRIDFYFIEYNQPEAQPIVEEFNIQQHPETFFINEKHEIIYKMEGYGEVLQQELIEQVENLL